MSKVAKGLMLFGVLLLGFGIYFVTTALASTSWDQVQGKIISTRIPAGLSNTGSSTQRHLVYRVEATYQYEVNGKTYENNYFSLGSGFTVEGGFNNKADAREWLKNSEYSTGKQVTVYVKPDEPETTVLSAGINIGTIVPIIMGLVFLALGYFLNKYIPPGTKLE
jgi:chitodextrinase